MFRFNPRTSCEVRHPIFLINRLERFVSIHAPLARCDCNHLGCYRHSHRFNPRTSCEVRLFGRICRRIQIVFQSTHLLRGATQTATWSRIFSVFQSTHLLRGATLIGVIPKVKMRFQSTHLLRGATPEQHKDSQHREVSIHAPLARCDMGSTAKTIRF